MSETDSKPTSAEEMPVLDLLGETPDRAGRGLRGLTKLWKFLRPHRACLLAALFFHHLLLTESLLLNGLLASLLLTNGFLAGGFLPLSFFSSCLGLLLSSGPHGLGLILLTQFGVEA